jgi:hypothetical protein
MSNDSVKVLVTLTREETATVDAKAKVQGISSPDFMSFSVRAITYGINYAISMLPKQGHVGTSDERD